MTAFVRGISFLIGFGLMMFGLLVTTYYVEEIPNLTLRELGLLDHPNLWDQYLGIGLGAALMVQGAVIDTLCLACFRGEQLRREVWAQKRTHHRRSRGRFRHLLVLR